MAGAESSSAPAGPHYGPIVVSAHIQASANIDVSSAIRCTQIRASMGHPLSLMKMRPGRSGLTARHQARDAVWLSRDTFVKRVAAG